MLVFAGQRESWLWERKSRRRRARGARDDIWQFQMLIIFKFTFYNTMEATRKRWRLSHLEGKGSGNASDMLSREKFRSKSKKHGEEGTAFAFKSISNQQIPSQKEFKEKIKGKEQQKIKLVEDEYQLGCSMSFQGQNKGKKKGDHLQS